MRSRRWKPEGTADSRRLCEYVSSRSGGVCVLGFSRGKDSLAAWLWLREFFGRVVPYTTVVAPHLGVVDRSLAYYEEFFGCKIERFIHADAYTGLRLMEYQPLEDEKAVRDYAGWEYDAEDLAELLRRKHDVPSAWAAFGISGADSIFRRQRMRRAGTPGRAAHDRPTFYPCFDWTREMILETVERSGVKLPGDYLLSNRSINNVYDTRYMDLLERYYPEDWERLELMHPFLRAQRARNLFRIGHLGEPGRKQRLPGLADRLRT